MICENCRLRSEQTGFPIPCPGAPDPVTPEMLAEALGYLRGAATHVEPELAAELMGIERAEQVRFGLADDLRRLEWKAQDAGLPWKALFAAAQGAAALVYPHGRATILGHAADVLRGAE